MINPSFYEGREQTLIKHFIFGEYLKRFAIIVGFRWEGITYVDGFSGPWNQKSGRYEDSSFGKALQELREAQRLHKDKKRDLKVRCFFVEKDPKAYALLKSFTDDQEDVEIETANCEFEEAVPQIVRFVRRSPAFPFIFIDPKGWKGFALRTIEPILRLNPGEVLINFQTNFIKRFIELASSKEDFEALFGHTGVPDLLRNTSGQDREDAAVREYMRCVKEAGGFSYACAAVVPRPEAERTHFHLVYLTRHPKGVEVFKDAEKRSVTLLERVWPQAKKRKREEKTGQLELPGTDAPAPSSHLEALHKRYCQFAQAGIQSRLINEGRLAYDEAWEMAMLYPLVWESDLKSWIGERQGRLLDVAGLKPRERVPKRGRNHMLIRRD